MALTSEGRKILMNTGDYGVDLPFKMSNFKFEPNDKFLFIITKNNGTTKILEKEYKNLTGDMSQFAFALSFTKEESAKLNKGLYGYDLIFIRENESIRSTVIANEDFRVGDEV